MSSSSPLLSSVLYGPFRCLRKAFGSVRNALGCPSGAVGSYQVFSSSSSCTMLGSNVRNVALCIGVVVVSFVLISSYYLSDSDYRRKLADIKSPRHARVNRPDSCSYPVCHPIKPGFLNVHVISHSHDDMGWLKTVKEYYTGGGDPRVPFSVRRIIGTVVEALNKNPERRFIQVETGFFSMWWKEQNDSTKALVHKLVNSGRLEFTGGAWSMNDEATAYYASIMDGFSLGLRLLNETFGRCGLPRIGWQIDPFGHSKEMASMFAQMGYEGFMFARIDYQDHEKRKQEKGLQMLWEANPDLGKSSHIFTEMFNNLYNPPSGFCFDAICGNDFIDDPTSPGYNANSKGNTFMGWAYEQSQMFRSSNIPVLFGGDFTHQNAEVYFGSVDRLIKYVNNLQSNGSKINLLYSTPSCYIKAVHDSGITLPTKQDDFFPYGSGAHAYWTGFFTSRPALKRYERYGHSMLQVCKQLYVLSNLRSHSEHNHESDLNVLREAMGVIQHHDGITGTAKQHPSNNYAELVHNGLAACEKMAAEAFQSIMKPSLNQTSEPPPVVPKVGTCHYLNVSSCQFTETWDKFVINVYNSLGRSVDRYVRVPVRQNVVYTIQDDTGAVLQTQMVPIHLKVLQMSERNSQKAEHASTATVELIFRASLPALGYASYFVTTAPVSQENSKSNEMRASTDMMIGTRMLGLEFNQTTGLITALLKNNISLPMTQSYGYYTGHVSDTGSNDMGEISSGAYIFKPDNFVSLSNGKVDLMVYKGPLVHEVHQTYSDPFSDSSFVSQIIRIYKGEDHIEFEWLVGPIPISDNIGKEIVTRYKIPSLNTVNRFYTDSNGREMLERIRNYRSTWDLQNGEPISANYYPVTSRISVKGDWLQMSVLTDRSQGGTSLTKGEIELMIHRRLLSDDGKGVEEPLNEPGVDNKGLAIRGQHWLTLGDRSTQSAVDRALSLELTYRPWLFFTQVDAGVDFHAWATENRMQYSAMKKKLPEGIHVLTLEPWTDGNILLRLEHTLQSGDHPELSKPASINLYKFFHPFRIQTIYETSLSGAQWYQDMTRMKWKVDPDILVHQNSDQAASVDRSFVDVFNITLTPMMIRTFVLSVEYRHNLVI
uniref:Alpha-mannosidase n=1 Tax=Cacopsylla melanoneura TaxID=428564 RepID=A0A8D8QN90_9HEMI